MTDQEKTAELLNLMDSLCDEKFTKDNSNLDAWINKLNRIYANEYRHSYSDIFFKLQQIISQEPKSEVLEILGENLNVLGNRINEMASINSEDANYANTASGYKKFADHIRLEIGRYNFIQSRFLSNQSNNEAISNSEIMPQETAARFEKLEKAIDDMRPTVTNSQKMVNQADQKLNEVDEKLENNKISSITTLTIFSAVILAFSGGITFESGIFKGIAESTPYRLVFAIALTGFILFNTIFILLYLVGKMADKKISTKCKYLSLEKNEYIQNKKCSDGYCTKECSEVNLACRMLHKYTYVFAVNCILLYVLYSDFFLWMSDGKLNNIVFWLAQAILGALILVITIIHFIRKIVRFHRIRLHYKVVILQDIVEPQEKSSTAIILSKLLKKVLSVPEKKSMSDAFLKTIQGIRGEEALGKLNEFIDEQLLYDNLLAISVSRRENKINKRKWEKLSKKFSNLDFQNLGQD